MHNSNRKVIDRETLLILKFIMKNIKNLVSDNANRKVFLKNFDNVFEEIFGYKNLGSKLNDCYDDRDVLIVVTDFGLKNLMSICNTPKLYAAFADVISINFRCNQLKKYFKRQEKKGKKKDKNFVKEYNYLNELYKDAIKTLRKRFDIPNKKKSYKKRFNAIQDIISTKKEYSFFDSDDDLIFGNSFYDDSDDTFDNEDPFDEFVRRATKKLSPSKPSRKIDLDFNDTDIDFETEDEEDENFDELVSLITEVSAEVLSPHIEKVNENVNKVAMAVQHLINTTPNKQASDRPQDVTKPSAQNDDRINTLIEAITTIAKGQQSMNNRVDQLVSTVNQLSEIVYYEDEEDIDNTIKTAPVTTPPKNNSAQNMVEHMINAHPDLTITTTSIHGSGININDIPSSNVYNDTSVDPRMMTREKLIDIVNGENIDILPDQDPISNSPSNKEPT